MPNILLRPLIAAALLMAFSLGLTATIFTLAQDDGPLLYLTDYAYMNDYYIVLDVETGKTTHRFQRPSDFQGPVYYGECCYEERQEITSPYDESVRLVLINDFNSQNPDESEQLYRVRENDQLEPVLSGEYIYFSTSHFTDNGRYVYLSKKSGSDLRNHFYTLYRYDLQSTELWIMAADVPDATMNCQENWCQVISGIPGSENSPQSLLVFHKNSGELREVVTADDITIHYWRGPNVLMYTAYDGDGQTFIRTYAIDTDQHRTLSEIEGQGIASIYGQDWLMVAAISPANDRIFDLYIVNDLASNPTTYPLGIQTSSASWLSYKTVSDGSMLLITLSPQNDNSSEVYIIDDVAAHPTIDQLINTDFDSTTLRDVRLEFELGDTNLLRVVVSDDEWRYYMLHVPTRTITQLATFNSRQRVVQTQFTADDRWLAVSIAESGEFYYVMLLSTDGSQPMRTWDVGAESYVCLLDWYKPDVAPPACDLYFGIG